MQTDYNEQDTERARAAERSSAGRQTTSLTELPSLPTGTVPASTPVTKRNNPIGLVLIGLGLILLLSRFFNLPELELEGGFIIFTVASCFLFFAFWKRIYGLFIPGAILTGVSLGVTFVDITNGASMMWGLSLAFMTILTLGLSLFGRGQREAPGSNLGDFWRDAHGEPTFAHQSDSGRLHGALRGRSKPAEK